MRLPKQKLEKKVHKRTQTAKHKKSVAKKVRVQAKRAKNADKEVVTMTNDDDVEHEMNTEEQILTEEEKYEAKMLRKKANVSKNSYKRGWIKTKHIR